MGLPRGSTLRILGLGNEQRWENRTEGAGLVWEEGDADAEAASTSRPWIGLPGFQPWPHFTTTHLLFKVPKGQQPRV